MTTTDELLAQLRQAAAQLVNCKLAVPDSDGARVRCARLAKVVAIVIDDEHGARSYVHLEHILGDFDTVRRREEERAAIDKAIAWLKAKRAEPGAHDCPICGVGKTEIEELRARNLELRRQVSDLEWTTNPDKHGA